MVAQYLRMSQIMIITSVKMSPSVAVLGSNKHVHQSTYSAVPPAKLVLATNSIHLVKCQQSRSPAMLQQERKIL